MAAPARLRDVALPGYATAERLRLIRERMDWNGGAAGAWLELRPSGWRRTCCLLNGALLALLDSDEKEASSVPLRQRSHWLKLIAGLAATRLYDRTPDHVDSGAARSQGRNSEFTCTKSSSLSTPAAFFRRRPLSTVS